MNGLEQDWRFQNAEPLRGQAFVWKPYRPYSETWDHDHCTACLATLALSSVPGALTEGWAITDGYRLGADYEWVCADCYDLLKVALEWTPR